MRACSLRNPVADDVKKGKSDGFIPKISRMPTPIKPIASTSGAHGKIENPKSMK